MKSYELICFDLDGTLTDPKSGLIKSFAYALDRMGISYGDPENLKKYIGPPLFDEWMGEFGWTREETQHALDVFHEYFGTRGWCDNVMYDGVPEMLERLRAAGKKLAVTTSKPEIYTFRILELFGLSPYFDVVGGALNESTRDKKWEVIDYVLSRFPDIPKEKCVIVGDRKYDAEGGALCGIDAVAVTYGYGDREEIRRAGFLASADSPSALADLLLGK